MTEASLRQVRAQQQQQYLQKMNQQQQTTRKLDLAELRSVKWAMSQVIVREVYRTALAKFNQSKKIALIGWMLVMMEMIFISWWTFIHNLPWPAFMLDFLAWADSIVLKILDFLQQRLEWYQDVLGVRFMWLRESMEMSVDKGITVLDVYFGRLQDGVIYMFDVMMTPARYVMRFADNYNKSRDFRKTVLREDSGRRAPSKNFDTESEDTEGYGDEDYMSDNSASGSKRLARKDMQGQLRQANGGATHSPVRRIFPGLLSKMGKGSRDSGSDGGHDAGDERKVSSRENSHSRSNSLRRLPRLFTSTNERKESSTNSVNANGESSPSGSKSDLQQYASAAKPLSPAAVVRASTASPTGSPSDSPSASPEGRRRGFGRFSSKRQRSRK